MTSFDKWLMETRGGMPMEETIKAMADPEDTVSGLAFQDMLVDLNASHDVVSSFEAIYTWTVNAIENCIWTPTDFLKVRTPAAAAEVAAKYWEGVLRVPTGTADFTRKILAATDNRVDGDMIIDALGRRVLAAYGPHHKLFIAAMGELRDAASSIVRNNRSTDFYRIGNALGNLAARGEMVRISLSPRAAAADFKACFDPFLNNEAIRLVDSTASERVARAFGRKGVPRTIYGPLGTATILQELNRVRIHWLG